MGQELLGGTAEIAEIGMVRKEECRSSFDRRYPPVQAELMHLSSAVPHELILFDQVTHKIVTRRIEGLRGVNHEHPTLPATWSRAALRTDAMSGGPVQLSTTITFVSEITRG